MLAAGPITAVLGQQHAFRQFTPKDGLAQSQVRAIAQDARGYLWFGTLGGASRFDGTFFENRSLQEGLPDAQISALATAADGTLWMGSGNSLVHVVGRSLVIEPLPASSRGARILGLEADPDGRIYIGTDGGGLYVRDGQRIGTLPGFPNDTASHIRSICLLKNGELLVGTRNGLIHCASGTCHGVQLGDSEAKIVSALAESRDGTWWIGTLGSGLYRIAPDGSQKEYDEETGLLQNNVRSLLVDYLDRLWVGTKLGANLLEDGRMRVFTVHQGMPNDNIQCMFQDAEGNIWFGSDGAGVVKYLGDRFVTFTTKDGLCSDLVMSVTADAHGDLWMGTYDNGICRKDGMAMITTLDGLPNNTIWCGLLARDGSLWFGTSDGLAHVQDGLLLPLSDSTSLLGQRVFALHQDSAGDIWCGTREGLAVLRRDGRIERPDPSDEGPKRSVRSIVPDNKGSLWLATDNGLWRYHGRSFQGYSKEEGLSDNTVLCLLFDRAGRLWAGTANGLSAVIGERIRTIRFASDFGSNYIDLLQMDELGRVWAGTNNGLFCFYPDSLLLDPTLHEHIASADGLRSLEFNLNAGYHSASGRLYFGSTSGLVLHDPLRSSARPQPPAPLVHIMGVRSFLQASTWKGQCDSLDQEGLPQGLHLSHQRHYLTFDFAAVGLTKPERVRYKYRLVGYDPDWLPATEARFASYSNLPHGEYTFQVSANVNKDEWSEPASFVFRIDAPYWARWWFYVLCAMAIAGILFGIQRFRAVRRERRERTRQLMLRSRMLQLEQQALNANMNRHFIFNALNSIQFHINKQDRSTASRYLTSFAKLIRKNLDASQNDTTTLMEELERLELYLKLEHMRFKDQFRYTIQISPDVDAAHVRLPAMMLQPYVENSIWHGILPMQEQGHVSLVVERGAEPGRVTIRIEDNGIGLEQSRRSKEGTESDHISRGIEITKGRVDVLRKLALTDIRIQGPEQWHDPLTHRVLGTRVIIDLPVEGSEIMLPENLRKA